MAGLCSARPIHCPMSHHSPHQVQTKIRGGGSVGNQTDVHSRSIINSDRTAVYPQKSSSSWFSPLRPRERIIRLNLLSIHPSNAIPSPSSCMELEEENKLCPGFGSHSPIPFSAHPPFLPPFPVPCFAAVVMVRSALCVYTLSLSLSLLWPLDPPHSKLATDAACRYKKGRNRLNSPLPFLPASYSSTSSSAFFWYLQSHLFREGSFSPPI